MTKLNQIFKCDICGHIIHIVHAGEGVLECCDEPMELMEEQTADFAIEKHVPVIEKQENGYLVKVGSTPHPMIDTHYIEWIELIADGVSYRQYLHPGDKPEAFFCIAAKTVSAREYCNIHKLWRS